LVVLGERQSGCVSFQRVELAAAAEFEQAMWFCRDMKHGRRIFRGDEMTGWGGLMMILNFMRLDGSSSDGF